MIGKYKFLVDSNIFIYHLNGEKIATTFLKENFKNICISRITFIEVLSFEFKLEDFFNVLSLLKAFKIIDTSGEVAFQCIKNTKIRKIKLADNIIASTAMVYDLILVTRNVKDFKKLNLKILNPLKKK